MSALSEHLPKTSKFNFSEVILERGKLMSVEIPKDATHVHTIAKDGNTVILEASRPSVPPAGPKEHSKNTPYIYQNVIYPSEFYLIGRGKTKDEVINKIVEKYLEAVSKLAFTQLREWGTVHMVQGVRRDIEIIPVNHPLYDEYYFSDAIISLTSYNLQAPE